MDSRSDRFAVLSARLTGFGRVTLLGTGMTAEYLAALDAVVGAPLVDELLASDDADALLHAGRSEEALAWFARAADSDLDGQTDADERLAELQGLDITDLAAADDELDEVPGEEQDEASDAESTQAGETPTD